MKEGKIRQVGYKMYKNYMIGKYDGFYSRCLHLIFLHYLVQCSRG